MGKIIVENIRLFGYHGCMLEEKRVGSHYTVNIKIGLDFNEASTQDDLSKTIDYVNLCCHVKKEMKINSKLIEHLAQRIIKRIKEKKILNKNKTYKNKNLQRKSSDTRKRG